MPFFSGKCYSQAKLIGKTAVITGCNVGIGKETVKDFYKRGGRIIMACRDVEKANAAMEDIKKSCEGSEGLGEITITKLDLNSLTSVRECAQQLLKNEQNINLLINNAGVMMCPLGKTEDGFETQIGTNHFGHFLFTILLLPRLIKSKPARIVTVSSRAHTQNNINFDDINYEKTPYNARLAYAQSKLANVLFSVELANKLKEHNIEGVNVYSLHPGVVATELGRHLNDTIFPGVRSIFRLFRWLLKTPEQGAQTTIYCAVDEKCANETGLYYSDCIPVETSTAAKNPESAKRLWDLSWNSVKLGDFNPFSAN